MYDNVLTIVYIDKVIINQSHGAAEIMLHIDCLCINNK